MKRLIYQSQYMNETLKLKVHAKAVGKIAEYQLDSLHVSFNLQCYHRWINRWINNDGMPPPPPQENFEI